MDCKEEVKALYKKYIDTQVKYAVNTEFLDDEDKHFINLYTLLFSSMMSDEDFSLKDFITAVYLKGWFKCHWTNEEIAEILRKEEI